MMTTRIALILTLCSLLGACPDGAYPVTSKAKAANTTSSLTPEQRLARDILTELITYRTAKGYEQVPAMATALAARFRAAGFSDDEIQMLPVRIEGEKTVGLVVRYTGSPGSKPPIALLGHMDVVDAVPENWETDPFKPTEKDHYLYGRGSIDNKAGVALLSATFISLKKEGYVPDRDLVIAFSGDEETGMQTTQLLAQHPFVKDAAFALNADAGTGTMKKDGTPVRFSIQSAEKTYADFLVSTTSIGGHSSRPKADNAIYELADALKRIQEYTFPVQFNSITRRSVRDVAAERGGDLGQALTTLLSDPNNSSALQVVAKNPDVSFLLRTTCVATMLRAGNAPNALPQNATATVNCRIFPGTTVADVQATLQKAIGNPATTISQVGESVESPVSPINKKLFASLRKAVHVNYPGAPVQPTMSAGGTDGRIFRSAGIPTYGAGSLAIVRPDDNRAHGTDERLPLKSFYKELEYWDVLLKDLAGDNYE